MQRKILNANIHIKGDGIVKCTVILDSTREEEILIYAHKKTPIINEIERMVKGEASGLIGFFRDEIVRFDVKDVYCFTVDNGKL